MLDWTRGETIESVLKRIPAAWHAYADSDEDAVPFRLRDASAPDIGQIPSAIQPPIPADVASMHRVIVGRSFHEPADATPPVFLYRMQDIHWCDPASDLDVGDMRNTHPDWYDARYLAIGRGIFGDTLAWCENAPGRSTGSIVLVDHEGGGPARDPNQPQGIIVLADSLADWLSRWMAFDFVEYAYVSGELKVLPPQQQRAFLIDHLRLNPNLAWASRRLQALL